MITFLRDGRAVVDGAQPTLFMAFFVYVWIVWTAKALIARRYRPAAGAPLGIRATVIVPVYREPEEIFRRVLASVRANDPAELIAVVDGGDADVAAVAAERCDRVISIPKSGKRAAIAAGLRASDPQTEVVVVLDSDTVWDRGALAQMLLPFGDPRVGGVTPRQTIFDVGRNPVRRLADWLEDLRYHLTVPAQSVAGQVGCLAGRTIAYRRCAFEPAVERLVGQTVLGVPQHIGDDRVLTSELLRRGWRTVYQSTAHVSTDAPSDWRTFWRQQLRWGRSSQRETLLSLPWLWRRPVAFLCFVTDIVTPFALYAVVVTALAHTIKGDPTLAGQPLGVEIPLAYLGMLLSIGIRQIPHVRRIPADVWRLPLFVLQLTLVMVPIRLLAFATMLHQDWATRSGAGDDGARPSAAPGIAPHPAPAAAQSVAGAATLLREVTHEAPRPESAHL